MAKKIKNKGLTSDDVKHWQDEVEDVKPRSDSIIEQATEEYIEEIADPDDIYESYLPIITSPHKEEKPEQHIYPYLELNDSSCVDGNYAHKLRAGKLKIEASIDLHGHYQDSAVERLVDFIDASYKHGKRCVRVITGKGKDAPTEYGVLYQNTPKWLNIEEIRPYILMFCHTQPKDGGSGALYVLLKRKR